MAEPLRKFFETARSDRPTYRWSRDLCVARDSDLLVLVRDLAERIMAYRCRGQPGRFEAWLSRRNGGPPLNDTVRRALEVVVGTAVGLPGRRRSTNHVEAFVAEHLWYFLTMESEAREFVVRVSGPSVEVTEIGGDGLTIHRNRQGHPYFRLWEVKKYSGNRSIAGTVSGACGQLAENALRYLNKFSLLGQEEGDAEIAKLYATLLDHWIDATSSAGAGVAVGTSSKTITTRSFQSLPRYFPRLCAPPRLQGHVAAVTDFAGFAEAVRDELWKGL